MLRTAAAATAAAVCECTAARSLLELLYACTLLACTYVCAWPNKEVADPGFVLFKDLGRSYISYFGGCRIFRRL